ncbi:MAG: LysR family transcriptional regulator [Oscillospiraceae bacterium]
MDLLQLRYFYTVANTLNISQAAAIHRISQPAMSATISKLESDLGTVLFSREKNHLSLTGVGLQFLHEVEQALNHLDSALLAIADPPAVLRGHLRLLVTMHRITLIDCISGFRTLHPEVTFSIVNTPDSSEQFDLCISNFLQKGHFDCQAHLFREEIRIAVPKQHPLAKRKYLDVQDLQGEPLIILNTSNEMYNTFLNMARNVGFTPNVSIVCNDLHSIRQYLIHNYGITFAPTIAWKDFCVGEWELLPLSLPFYRDVYMYWNRSAIAENPAASVFKDYTAEVFRNLAEEYDA